MAPRCVYCRVETTRGEGRGHILPEAIVANDLVLPSGAYCDACNNYLGKLDSALVSYRIVLPYVQFLGLPGKGEEAPPDPPERRPGPGGRVRGRRGGVAGVRGGGYPELDCEASRHSGHNSVEFARALHRLAFDGMVSVHGAELALEEAFDPVREFIGIAKRGEGWPYSTWTPSQTSLRRRSRS